MDRAAYDQQILKIINDTNKFKPLSTDPTISRENKLQRTLRDIRRRGQLDQVIYERIYPCGSQPARIYGLPKMHKPRDEDSLPPFRPIISCIGSYNYMLAKYLSELLTPHIPSEYSVHDSFSFVKEINDLDTNNRFMVSFDIVSLFTNIPLEECIDLAVKYTKDGNPNLKLTHEDLRDLFKLATTGTHFLFKGNFYEQVDGVAMGSPLAPILANLFMGHHEKNWLDDYKGPPVLFYRRYVDDTFCLFNNKQDVDQFFQYINGKHSSIKYTKEEQTNNTLPFLDIRIDNSREQNVTSIFRKPTFMGLFNNFTSFSPIAYKRGLIRTLIDRVYKINNTWIRFNEDLKNLKHILQRNLFPSSLIDKCIENYLNNIFIARPDTQKVDQETRYYKLPYIGHFSKIAQIKLDRLVKQHCKNINIKLAFTTFKIGSLFTVKDPIPKELKSCVVYKFCCASCNACYVGQTIRHFKTRRKEHLFGDKSSHVYKHVHNTKCGENVNNECFSIIDSDNTEYKIKIKEAMHIKWLRPSLNQQVKHLALSLSL
ncbi:uncharacterized protein LOC110244161 [Exaiptasia diaphana]|uniref:Reverse transcriptase domain-containing protein n=1 Tax=Exaiptasia diaphana TaxID=2652724 RepID=A0A913XK01_EXADI|nr:uncharacterized protein LOC110244161 [Exaiptasia diaphana]